MWTVLLSLQIRMQCLPVPPALQLAGKLSCRPPLVSIVGLYDSSCAALLTIRDSVSGIVFMIDTSAQVSVIIATCAEHASAAHSDYSPNHLQAPNGSCIKLYAYKFMNLCFSGRRFRAHILCADVQHHLLGDDVLHEHQLLVDLAIDCLVDATHCFILPSDSDYIWYSAAAFAAHH